MTTAPFPADGNYPAKISGSDVEFRASGVMYRGKAEFAVKGIGVNDNVVVGDGKVWSRLLGELKSIVALLPVKVEKP